MAPVYGQVIQPNRSKAAFESRVTIPASQLDTWTHRGATTTAKATHEAIRSALASSPDLISVDYDVYLQGSYRNATNIRGDSDVDVVVQLDEVFHSGLDWLDERSHAAHESSYAVGAYQLQAFRRDVLAALRARFGVAGVSEGNKAVRIAPGPGRIAADVIICTQYRLYTRFVSLSDQQWLEGITFWTVRDSRQIVNYPKYHYSGGVKKNNQTDQHYKPSARMFKNARLRAVERGLLSPTAVPSYHLECFLSNATDSAFSAGLQATYLDVLDDLLSRELSACDSQNGFRPLFGTSPEQWNTVDATAFISALVTLWRDW